MILNLGCSVYKSEGRKKFETQTPERVPIAYELSCFPYNPLEENVITEEITLTKQNPSSPHLNIEDANPFRTVVSNSFRIILVTQVHDHLTLVIKNSDSLDHCLSLPISKSEYSQNKQNIINEINSWP